LLPGEAAAQVVGDGGERDVDNGGIDGDDRRPEDGRYES